MFLEKTCLWRRLYIQGPAKCRSDGNPLSWGSTQVVTTGVQYHTTGTILDHRWSLGQYITKLDMLPDICNRKANDVDVTAHCTGPHVVSSRAAAQPSHVIYRAVQQPDQHTLGHRCPWPLTRHVNAAHTGSHAKLGRYLNRLNEGSGSPP